METTVQIARKLYHLDSKDPDRLRDVNGKPVAHRVGSDKAVQTLSEKAAAWMTGRKVLMGDLTPGDVASPTGARAEFHIYADDFVADIASPVREVPHDRGVWWTEKVLDELKPTLGISTQTGNPPILNSGFANTQFVCSPYALADSMPHGTVVNADFPIMDIALRRVCTALRLARELRVASLLTTSTNWASANVTALAAGQKWNGGATADPIAALYSARSNSALPVTTMIVPESVEPFFFSPTGTGAAVDRVQQFVQGGGRLPRIVVARAKFMLAAVPVYVWAPANPSPAVLIREPMNEPDLCTSRTLRWLGIAPDGEAKNGFLVRTYREGVDPNARDWVVVCHADTEQVVSNQVGALITGATQ